MPKFQDPIIRFGYSQIMSDFSLVPLKTIQGMDGQTINLVDWKIKLSMPVHPINSSNHFLFEALCHFVLPWGNFLWDIYGCNFFQKGRVGLGPCQLEMALAWENLLQTSIHRDHPPQDRETQEPKGFHLPFFVWHAMTRYDTLYVYGPKVWHAMTRYDTLSFSCCKVTLWILLVS